MRQGFTIAIILFGIFLLGMWGQYLLAPEQLVTGILQAIYNTLTLFVLEGEWTANQTLPWQLEVTRFVAPLASITGVLVYLTQGAWNEAVNYFVRLKEGHVVVAGLGRRSWQFVQSCHGHYKLVIVEANPDNPFVERARSMKMSVIVGDILDPAIFDKANLAKAHHLVAFTGEDGVNVELAIKARTFMREHGAAEQLLVHMHVDNTHIAERLQNYPKFYADSAAAQVNFFSVYDLNARILFRDYPPECFAHYFGQDQVHLALYNFGRQAEHILLEAVRICHFANESQVRFSVFDSSATKKSEIFLSTYPHLESLCEIKFIEMPVMEAKALESVHTELLQTVTEHIICLEDDSDNLDLALLLRSTLLNRKACNSPIIVHMAKSSGLAQLLESNFGGPEIPDGLYPFGMLDQVLNYENVLADGLDLLARAFHSAYLDRREGLEVDKRLYSSLYDWVALSEPERASSRQSADHLATKLRAIGCATSTVVDPEFRFTDEEALLLTRMEHSRWCSEKVSNGWQYGPERIESAKLNPVIGKWQDLEPAEQESQIAFIKRLPEMMGKMDIGFVRDYRIGVTGHRLHKLDITDVALRNNIESTLADIVSEHPGCRFVITSPLAEGADRLVAKIAREKFGMSLHVPLPLPYELYHTDFTSVDSIEEFKVMVGQADVYFELATRFGNQEELASHIDGSTNDARSRQYAMAGAYIVNYCDELIAVWNGEPEGGVGGTGQVVRWSIAGKAEEEFQIHSDFFKKREINPPRIITHKFVSKNESSEG